jgi:hypothetical protein
MMLQRGRRSAAALAIADAPIGELPNARQPAPPSYLGQREAALWWALVDRMGSDYFPRETHGLLATMCAVQIQLDAVNEGLMEFTEGLPKTERKMKRYKELTRLRTAVSAQLGSIATKLRLTPQARYDHHRAMGVANRRPAQGSERPWEDG